MGFKERRQEKIFNAFKRYSSVGVVAHKLKLSEPTVRKYLKQGGFYCIPMYRYSKKRYFNPQSKQTLQLNLNC